MSVHIDDLPPEILDMILGFLEDKQLFRVERVSKNWQKSVKRVLGLKKTLKKLNYYSEKFEEPSYERIIINNDNIDIFTKILLKYPNIKHLDLSRTTLTGSNKLLSIAKLCSKLESIDFTGSRILKVSHQEINEFAKTIGPQLIKCNIGFCKNFIMIFIIHLKNIEEISWNIHECSYPAYEEAKKFFHHMNLGCKKLKIFNWEFRRWYFKNIDYQDENLISVLQRVKHLKLVLPILLKFNFEINNLNELTIYHHNNIDDVMKNEKIFVNLTKLNIDSFDKKDFDLISEFKFPNLESVSIINYEYEIPQSFIQQIKHIKFLNIKGNLLTRCLSSVPSIISQIDQLDQLDQFVWNHIKLSYDNSFEQLFKCFDILAQHKSLKNFMFDIEDENMKMNKHLDKLITFCELKLNSKFVIKIPKCKFRLEQKHNEYKKIFGKAKLHNLKIECLSKT